MFMKHPECDLRRWLTANEHAVDPYTRQRIDQSYRFIDTVLSTCDAVVTGKAYDVGCGRGYDSFAIGRYFDHVLAIDTDPGAIEEASCIAREAGVSHITFKRANIESLVSPPQFDFVYCNLMSHNVSSRCALIRALRRTMKPNAYLSYSEIVEGYGPMEIHRAIRDRNQPELMSRIRQVLRGFAGQSNFRFFLGGTIQPLLKAAGLGVVAHEFHSWNGMAIFDRTISKSDGETRSQVRCADPDYLEMSADFIEMRAQLTKMLSGRPHTGFSPDQRQQIGTLLKAPGNRYAPFLIFLSMADIALPSFRLASAPIRKSMELWRGIRGRLGFGEDGRAPRSNLDWTALEELDLRFIELMRRKAGLGTDSLDD